MWVFERTGELVGYQDAVLERTFERGTIRTSGISLANRPVIRKRFRQVRYLAPLDREYADPLGSVLRLPRFDGPGMLFDHGHKAEPAPRQELMELVPTADALARAAAIEVF